MQLPAGASLLATWAALTVMASEILLVARHGPVAAVVTRYGPVLGAAPAVRQEAAPSGRDPRYLASIWVAYAAADARAHGGVTRGVCSDQVGENFLHQWASVKSVMCGGGATGAAGNTVDGTHGAPPGGPDPLSSGGRGELLATPGTSHAECYVYPKGYGAACVSNNLLLNATAFMGPPTPPGSAEHTAYLPAGGPGSVRLACKSASLLDAEETTSGARRWTHARDEIVRYVLAQDEARWFKPPAFEPAAAGEVAARCADGAAGGVFTHPVMFVSRLDTTNPYWWTQSLLQAFMTLATLDTAAANATDGALPPFARELQVILADHFQPGPFQPVWERLSAPHPVLSLAAPPLKGAAPCFRTAVHAHYIGTTHPFEAGPVWRNVCASSILAGLAHWQRFLFRDVLPAEDREDYAFAAAAAAAASAPGAAPGAANAVAAAAAAAAAKRRPADGVVRRLYVVWLSRQWFVRRMAAGGGLTNWQQKRRLDESEELAVVEQLEAAVLAWNARACAPPAFGWWQDGAGGSASGARQEAGCWPTNVTFEFRYVDLSAHELFPEQAVLLSRAAVLVGPHGAALNNMIWMRPHRGAVIEYSSSRGNYRYPVMAKSLGHYYQVVAPPSASEWQQAPPRFGPLRTTMPEAVEAAMNHVAACYSGGAVAPPFDPYANGSERAGYEDEGAAAGTRPAYQPGAAVSRAGAFYGPRGAPHAGIAYATAAERARAAYEPGDVAGTGTMYEWGRTPRAGTAYEAGNAAHAANTFVIPATRTHTAHDASGAARLGDASKPGHTAHVGTMY